ncbi:MAG: hypothetical protein KDC98_09260 [Planctomycetes bacterium]|nr:hypothetical protein [Planctomycetota bacterium]
MASKIGERIYVEAFFARLNESYSIIEERESPDFLIACGGEQFGLEVVQMFRDQASVGKSGSPAKSVESRRTKGLRQLAVDYYAADGLPLHLQASFSDPTAVKRHGLVTRLKAARPSVPWARTTLEEDGLTLHLVALPPEAGQYRRWVSIDNSMGWRGQVGLADVLPVIQDKAARLPTYRSAVARVELLIVVDGTRRSGMVRWDASQVLRSRHGFDAIHLYFHPEEVLRIV